MENVVVASFDPTVFSSNPLSDMVSFSTIKWKQAVLNYPRLCTAHLALKMPIVLTTAANIRKREKSRCFPRITAVYFDAFTRQFHVPSQCPNQKEVEAKFSQILNATSTDEEIVRFFTRCANIAKNNYRRKNEHRHMPKAIPVDLELEDIPEEKPTVFTADLSNSKIAHMNRMKDLAKSYEMAKTSPLAKEWLDKTYKPYYFTDSDDFVLVNTPSSSHQEDEEELPNLEEDEATAFIRKTPIPTPPRFFATDSESSDDDNLSVFSDKLTKSEKDALSDERSAASDSLYDDFIGPERQKELRDKVKQAIVSTFLDAYLEKEMRD